jgi:two-component system, OmpR family, sensor histidine kinase KdpD
VRATSDYFHDFLTRVPLPSKLAALAWVEPEKILRAVRTDTLILSRYLQGLGISALCTAIAYPLYPHFDPVNIVMVYLLGAAIAGLRLGRGPAALTAITNTATFDFLFVPPRYSFYVSETQYLFTLGVMLGVAFLIANLMVNVRRKTDEAAERERRTGMLYAMSRDLAAAADAAAIANVAARHVASSLGESTAVLLPDEQGNLSVQGQSGAPGPAVEVADAQLVLDPIQERLAQQLQQPSAKPFYLPLRCGDRRLGVLAVQISGACLLHEQLALLDVLAGQTALALERARLAELAAVSRAAAERAALRSTLLASISHDLRGPLSAIAGAGSLVAQSGGVLDRHKRQTLGHLIEEKARDMSELLANVLELMRLETNPGALQGEWQSLEELVGIAIRNNEHRFGQRRVTTDIPADFPAVLVDGQLAVQLLSNLLENATKHTPAGTSIAIRAAAREGRAIVIIEDDGPGFGARDPQRLFEKFERGRKESHVSGVGLGLAICRAITHLHGGEIHASNGSAGGARIELTLPVDIAAEVGATERVS